MAKSDGEGALNGLLARFRIKLRASSDGVL
ncbi:hypothetical protein C7450_101627 [Chelatococcus asaccharovorans]|uniref:Uncharacterized protein n=1 Tax=Chelatococcus asaccharovorans TaxID=28210 RepID=A0A2V3UVX2_9HYPH|nr:hypothetical protein C7450_101627 [Chelatococcus asaccharovorans]